MNEEERAQYEKIEVLSDNLRFVLDLVCSAMDERNSEETRTESVMEIASQSHLHSRMVKARDLFLSMANRRTDRDAKAREIIRFLR